MLVHIGQACRIGFDCTAVRYQCFSIRHKRPGQLYCYRHVKHMLTDQEEGLSFLLPAIHLANCRVSVLI